MILYKENPKDDQKTTRTNQQVNKVPDKINIKN